MKKIIIIWSCLTLCSSITLPKDFCNNKQAYEHRYTVIKDLLNKYSRPITLLELGGNEHGLSFTIAKEYDSVCITAKQKNIDQQLKLCNEHTYENVILLNKNLPLDSLKKLGGCEHFDIVLAYDIIQHYGEQWQEAIEALLTFGDYIIIEIPPINNRIDYKKAIKKYLVQYKGSLLAESYQCESYHVGDLFLFPVHKNILVNHHWRGAGTYRINSDFEKKTLIKKRHGITTTTPWDPGINLKTFKRLQGVYPSNATIRKLLEPLKYINHNDLYIYNIIIQGKKLLPIDFNDLCKPVNPQQTIQSVLNNYFPEK